jgi:hypothetical protein
MYMWGGDICHREMKHYTLKHTHADTSTAAAIRRPCAFQVLDYVTGILMGAKGFLPNLHAGTAAAYLTRLLTFHVVTLLTELPAYMLARH